MPEHEYPDGHPAHRAIRGTKQAETHTDFGYDYAPNHPARGGQGQPVLTEQGSHVPFDGYKHLFELQGHTLAERLKSFAALSKIEQEERLEWNETGVPAELLEEG